MATSEDRPILSWNRPESVEYPKIWLTFQARDTDSDSLVEYRIQDLPLDRIDDYCKYLLVNFIPDEPVAKAFGYLDDPDLLDDYIRFWKPAIEQRMSLVCFKEGSDEIVGAHIVSVSTKDDNYNGDIRKVVKGYMIQEMFDLVEILHAGYDTFEAFKVDKYLSSLGLSVHRQYRGRGIGDQFLICRKAMCREFGLKMAQTSFSSDFSNANADKAGFKTDVALRYSDIVKKYPRFEKRLAGIASDFFTLKSWSIGENSE